MKLENKVLKIFGKVIRPANWFIFLSGILLMVVAPAVWFFLKQDTLTSGVLFIQGVQLVVEGYGEIKADEDVEAQ